MHVSDAGHSHHSYETRPCEAPRARQHLCPPTAAQCPALQANSCAGSSRSARMLLGTAVLTKSTACRQLPSPRLSRCVWLHGQPTPKHVRSPYPETRHV
eukprot:366195-Chlamydomonas_euryale.AAC.4